MTKKAKTPKKLEAGAAPPPQPKPISGAPAPPEAQETAAQPAAPGPDAQGVPAEQAPSAKPVCPRYGVCDSDKKGPECPHDGSLCPYDYDASKFKDQIQAPNFEERVANALLKSAEAVDQMMKVVSRQGEQINRLNEAVMELHQQPQQAPGGDIMALAQSPIGQTLVAAITKYLQGPQSSDPYQQLITEDARKEISQMFVQVVKGRWQTALNLVKATEAGQIEFRVAEAPPPPPSFDAQPKPGGDKR